MICKDMKYIALYWALEYEEIDLDKYIKIYNNYEINIFAENQLVDYGTKIVTNYNRLDRHKDFVVLECVDRLLLKGYKPENISLFTFYADIEVRLGNGETLGVWCEEWGKDYYQYKEKFNEDKFTYNVLYTSHLTSGLLEYKNIILANKEIYEHGIFDEDAKTYNYSLSKELKPNIENNEILKNSEIFEDELIRYHGKSKIVIVPNGIKSLGASAFWNNNYIEEVYLPDSLEKFGGDTFYYCKNLRKINIPKNVKLMGNNPFAACPNVEIINESKNYILKDGMLYNKDMTRVICYLQTNKAEKFIIPDGIKYIGKHCFYGCNNLKEVVIPESVIHLENNPFSDCMYLKVTNNSKCYNFENGIIYNKYKTTILGCLPSTHIEELIIPKTVTAIGRNSFWNAKGIKKLVITRNIDTIGYNPFASAENMRLTLKDNKYFKCFNNIIYNLDMTHIMCATNIAVGKSFKLPDTVTHINRGVFSGCVDLSEIDFNNVTYIDKSSFTNCIGLTSIYIPDKVTYIGEWVFAYCTNLKKISIKKGTYIDENAFNECPAKIEWRE